MSGCSTRLTFALDVKLLFWNRILFEGVEDSVVVEAELGDGTVEVGDHVLGFGDGKLFDEEGDLGCF